MSDIVEVTGAQPQTPAEPAAPAAPAAPVGDTGKAGPAKPWMAQLKKELQSNQALSQFDDFSSVAERWLEVEAKKDRLFEIPGADATDEVKAQVKAKLVEAGLVPKGVEKPEDYKVSVNLPQGVKLVPEAEAEFRSLAHKAKLTDEQLNVLLDFDVKRTVARLSGTQAQLKAQADAQATLDKKYLGELQTSWGSKFEENKAKAVEAMNKATSEDLRKLLMEAKLPGGGSVLDHPLVAKHYFDLANAIGETGFIKGGLTPPQKSRGFLTADNIAELKRDGILKE